MEDDGCFPLPVHFHCSLQECSNRMCEQVLSLENIKSFLVRGQEICFIFDTWLLDYLIYYYFKISE